MSFESFEIHNIFRGLIAPSLRPILVIPSTSLMIPGHSRVILHSLRTRHSFVNSDTQGNMLNAVPSRANLTTLELSNYSSTHADIQNLFDASPGLETLILHGFDRDEPLERDDEDDGAPITITTSATSKSLAVSICYTHSDGTSMCGCVLDKLCIPNLEYLELVGATIDLNVYFKEVAKLQTLRLQRCHITSVNQFFPSLKEVRRLELVEISP
ncbi:hypothetical protein IW261DRAFT_1629523 [Armillaria novae-zelandiae]|uniref:Uncharacterized protein n=1 Tax=Armillaria novae-zelandiae TaxID=153914 RepID=A0AA39U620_9AGAR|nr:hypothetical protein IW261DRAFT_1629523 [Armillaria novae-zelandiae]